MYEDTGYGTQPQSDRAREKELKGRIHHRLLETLDLNEARRMAVGQLHAECSKRIDALLREYRTPLSAPEKAQLIREVLDEIFEEFGGIEDARIVRRAGGESRGFAYVTLKDGAGAARARAELDGRDRGGRTLRVELAR